MKARVLGRGLTVLILAALAAISTLPQTKRVPSDSDINLIGKRTLAGSTIDSPIDHEIREGEEMAREIEWRLRLIHDPLVTEYVNHIAQLLGRNSDATMPITVYVNNWAPPAAAFLPGGQLFINAGLILQTQNEAELAGILAHGIAHSALRTGTHSVESCIWQLIAFEEALIMGLPAEERLSEPFMFLTIGAPPAPGLRGRWDSELDADYFGLQYVYKAGFDPNCYIDLISRIPRDLKKKIPVDDIGHPITNDRVMAMREEVAQILPRREADVVSTSEFDAVRELLRVNLSAPSFKKLLPDGPPRIRYATNHDRTARIN